MDGERWGWYLSQALWATLHGPQAFETRLSFGFALASPAVARSAASINPVPGWVAPAFFWLAIFFLSSPSPFFVLDLWFFVLVPSVSCCVC
jgi:hypothetical protein